MTKMWARDRATLFYITIGVVGIVVILIGFGRTYAAPMWNGQFSAPWIVHLHGAAALSWVVLLIGQATLVRGGRTKLHRRLGRSSLPLAILIWLSGIFTGVWAAKRDISIGGSAATSSLAGTTSGLTLFLLLVIAALATRRRPDWHKRLMLLATIQLLWPAFFRLRHWLPNVPNPEIWFALVLAYSPILIAASRDRLKYGKVHPVWLYVAPALVIEQSLETVFFDKGPHRYLGQMIFGFLA